LQFLPFWIQRQALCPSGIKSCCRAPARSIHFSTSTSQIGLRPLLRPRNHCLADRPFGANLFSRLDRLVIEASMVEPPQWQRYLASVAPHSGDWLLALPIANCGLRLEDEAVRVAVGMRLGLSPSCMPGVLQSCLLPSCRPCK